MFFHPTSTSRPPPPTALLGPSSCSLTAIATLSPFLLSLSSTFSSSPARSLHAALLLHLQRLPSSDLPPPSNRSGSCHPCRPLSPTALPCSLAKAGITGAYRPPWLRQCHRHHHPSSCFRYPLLPKAQGFGEP